MKHYLQKRKQHSIFHSSPLPKKGKWKEKKTTHTKTKWKTFASTLKQNAKKRKDKRENEATFHQRFLLNKNAVRKDKHNC
jgi:hypothetical protein